MATSSSGPSLPGTPRRKRSLPPKPTPGSRLLRAAVDFSHSLFERKPPPRHRHGSRSPWRTPPAPKQPFRLTPRLIRAGLVFVILGTTAAVLPYREMAHATTGTGNCNGTTHTYAVYAATDPGGSGSSVYTVGNGTTTTVLVQEDGGAASGYTLSSTSTSHFTVMDNGSGSISVAADHTAGQSIALTVTFTDTNTSLTYTLND